MPEQRSPAQTENASSESLRPLLRMRQLALDIQRAIDRNDMRLVYKATGLLPHALAQVQAAYAALPPDAEVAMELATEARILLDQCETALRHRMANASGEIRRLKRGRRILSQRKAMHAVVAVGSRLNLAK